MKKSVAKEIVNILADNFTDKPALNFGTPYQLLVAVILSAQCTDARVNKITAELFKDYGTPEKMMTLSASSLGEKIFSCGLYKSKAEHILQATKDILERFMERQDRMESATACPRISTLRTIIVLPSSFLM